MPSRAISLLSAFLLFQLALGAADTRLLDAIRNDDVRAVQSLLKSGADPNMRDETGATALMLAAAFASSDTVRLLVGSGADINAVNSNGSTALMWATGETAKVRLLLDRGAMVDAKTKDGITALLSSAYRGNTAAMQLLLAKGADPRAGFEGPTLLVRIANATGGAEMRRVLARAGFKPKSSADLGPSPIADLLFNRADLGVLEKALDLGANPNEEVRQATVTFPALGIAASQGHAEFMRLLIERGADINRQSAKGWSPLMMAAARGDLSGPPAYRTQSGRAGTRRGGADGVGLGIDSRRYRHRSNPAQCRSDGHVSSSRSSRSSIDSPNVACRDRIGALTPATHRAHL